MKVVQNIKAAKLVGALVLALGSSLAIPSGLADTNTKASGNTSPKAGAKPQVGATDYASESIPIRYSERQLRLRLYPCQDCHRLTGEGYDRKGKYHYNIDYDHFDNLQKSAQSKAGLVAESQSVQELGSGPGLAQESAALGEHHSPTCLVCHDGENRDQLRLPTSVGGATVSFNESYKQCLSCHGDKQADYYAGIHGKDVGGYGLKAKSRSKGRGNVRIRLQCVDCHNPHSPKRPQVTPLPPPRKPKTLIPKGGH